METEPNAVPGAETGKYRAWAFSGTMVFSAVIRKAGSIYVAWCPDVDVASQGPSVEKALENLKEAVELYLDDDDAVRPEGVPLVTSFEVRHDKVPGSVGA